MCADKDHARAIAQVRWGGCAPPHSLFFLFDMIYWLYSTLLELTQNSMCLEKVTWLGPAYFTKRRIKLSSSLTLTVSSHTLSLSLSPQHSLNSHPLTSIKQAPYLSLRLRLALHVWTELIGSLVLIILFSNSLCRSLFCVSQVFRNSLDQNLIEMMILVFLLILIQFFFIICLELSIRRG